MSYRLPPLSSLRAFESAGRHLSFKKAALELHVTPAAISQQIKSLEDFLGVSLFRRLTRSLELTPHGTVMLPMVREGFDCLAAAVESIRQVTDTILTVTAPPSFAARWLVPRLPRFWSARPEMAIRLASSPNNVDNRSSLTDVDSETIDPHSPVSEVAIRYGTGNYPGHKVVQIFTPDCIPVCSPRLPTPERPLGTLADLSHHTLIHDETTYDAERQLDWAEWLKIAGAPEVDPRPGPRFSNALLAIEAALDGQGVALALKPLVATDLAAGRLIAPFDIAIPSPYSYYLVAHSALANRPAVMAFSLWLLGEVAAEVESAP